MMWLKTLLKNKLVTFDQFHMLLKNPRQGLPQNDIITFRFAQLVGQGIYLLPKMGLLLLLLLRFIHLLIHTFFSCVIVIYTQQPLHVVHKPLEQGFSPWWSRVVFIKGCCCCWSFLRFLKVSSMHGGCGGWGGCASCTIHHPSSLITTFQHHISSTCKSFGEDGLKLSVRFIIIIDTPTYSGLHWPRSCQAKSP